MTVGMVDLDESAARDPGWVGSKAAVLARLRAAGERVPEGLVALPDADPSTVARAAVRRFGDRPLAVRSSSVAEDLGSASYAGQYRTVLEVCGEEAIASAVGEVRASAVDAVAREYRTAGPAAMPVLVMPMVAAQAGGVAFSANPVTGDDEVIVEAVRGLGEGLASGTVTPQRFVCRDGAAPDEQPGGEPAISQDQAAEIAASARRLAALLGGPQDVEWAITEGHVHLLQSRPITALPIPPHVDLPGPREVWMRADENYAHPVRPLEFSVWAPRLEATTRKVFAEVGAPIEALRYRTIGGWMYSRFIPPMDQGKDDQATPPAWLFGLLLHVVPPLRSRLKRAALVWRSDLASQAADAWDHAGRAAMRARSRELRLTDRAALGDGELAAHLDDVLVHLQAASDVHFRLPVLATFLPIGHLGVLGERVLGWTPEQTLRLLQGYSAVTDAADDLDIVVDAVAADPAAAHMLTDDPLSLVDHPGPAGQALRANLERHGHACVGMDLAHPTWAEDPRPLLAMLRARLDHRDTARSEGLLVARVAEEEARQALAHRPADLAAFEEALAVARRGVSYGDDTETDVLQALGLVRYACVEAGRRLTARGLLHRPDDVVFLAEVELLAALRGQPLDLDIDRRRGEYLWAKAHPGPKRYGPPPPPWPSMRWAPKAARPFLEAMVWTTDKVAATPATEPPSEGTLTGAGASPGRVTGTVRVIRDPSEFDRIQPDDVLVCPCTIAAWSVVFPLVSAVVTEVGGPLSHPGILAREFGIPAVLGVEDATRILHDGQTVTVDGTNGRVQL